MIITTRQLFFSLPTLARLNACQLPVALSIRLRLLLLEMGPRYEVINALKSAIIGHYSVVGEDGSSRVDPDRREAYIEAMDALFNAPVALSFPGKLQLSDLQAVPGFTLSASEQELLEQWLLEVAL